MATPRARPTSPAKIARRAAAPPAAPRLSLKEVMGALERAGTAQTRKTYARHGAAEPMFGVSFATLATLVKRIGVDHDLAMALWDTRNFDARNLAMKIADPTRFSAADLDRWAKEPGARMCEGYLSMLAQEGGKGLATAARWLGAKDDARRRVGWGLVAQLAAREPGVADAWFVERLAEIEASIHGEANGVRAAMNQALIAIGGRNAALRKTAVAAARRIGTVQVDHGDTACKTPDAVAYIEKMWAHATAKGFASPSAQESAREVPRTRC